MTEPTFDPIIDDDREARLRQLQARRAGVPPAPTARTTPRKQHAAQGSRVVAAGFGLASMLALVGVMGLANRPTGASSSDGADAVGSDESDGALDTSADSSVEPRPVEVIVVIHQGSAEVPTGEVPVGEPQVVTATKTVNGTEPVVPITATAKPVVKAPSTKQRTTDKTTTKNTTTKNKTTKKKTTTKKKSTKSTKKKTKTNGSK